MEIRKPANWMNAKEMAEKALEVRYSGVTNTLRQIMLNISKVAGEGQFATTIILKENIKIISKILEKEGYKVNFSCPDGEYSRYIVTWEVEEEE